MPQRIGEYILQSRLGAGSFGQVWLAHHHVWIDRLAAVKIPTDPQYIRQLQREGVTLHALPHPAIVQPIGFDPYADPPYLIMEYVPGSSLRPLIQERRLSIDESLAVLRQILGALSFAHARGVIHGDIKPENILIHKDAATRGYAAPGMVKVTDFGLGQSDRALPGGSILHSVSLDQSQGARIAGTLDYLAPETRQNPPVVDARADLYACGVILYEMLTGVRPAGLELPSDRNPAASRQLDGLFRKAYARLDNRFQSADEFIAAMDGAGVIQPRTVARKAARPRQPGICPACHARTGADDQFCLHCGRQLVDEVLRCPQCGAYPDPDDNYCILCGAALDMETAVTKRS